MGSNLEENDINVEDAETRRINENIKEFEEKLSEQNMHLFRQLRLKDFLVKIKTPVA